MHDEITCRQILQVLENSSLMLGSIKSLLVRMILSLVSPNSSVGDELRLEALQVRSRRLKEERVRSAKEATVHRLEASLRQR
jgi:hypothetical protein